MRYRTPIILACAIALAAFALLAAGCGGSNGSNVAELGATTAQRASSSGSSNAGVSANSQMLAYAHCMRAHGVPPFPDPNSGGQIPKTEVVNARKDNPSRFDSADTACRHLAPNGGNGETPPR